MGYTEASRENVKNLYINRYDSRPERGFFLSEASH